MEALPPHLRAELGEDAIREDSREKAERAKLLLPFLADPYPRVRVRALRHSEDREAIPWASLRALLSDPDAAVRAAACAGFSGTRMPSAVRDGEVAHDKFGLRTLEENEGPPPEVAAAILAGLRDADGEVRTGTASMLDALGPLHPKRGEAFRLALTDRSRSVREAALRTLAWMQRPVPDQVDVVEPFLDDEEVTVRESAIRALGRHERLPATTLARLIALTADESASIRADVADALGEPGVKSEAVVQALMSRIEDEDKKVRMNSRMAPRKLGIRPPKPRKR